MTGRLTLMPFLPGQSAAGASTLPVISRPAESDEPDAAARRISGGVARGDEEAFTELYDRYHGRLLRLTFTLGRGDEALSRETVQSTLLTAARKLKRVESEAHLWNWLARVARQHLAKAWRQQQRSPAWVELGGVPETAAASTAADSRIEEELDAALLELEADDRQLVEGFYFEALSHKALAERLGVTPKAVAGRLDRARARLRTLLTRRLHES
jgi:RNA polymerase sigma-70 factor (ECF subfamily)